MGSRLIAVAVAGLLAACGSENLSGPAPERLCRAQASVEICVDRAEYRPGDTVRVTVTNTGSETRNLGGCSTKLVGKTSPDSPFEADYDPTLLCGASPSSDDILGAMIEVPPGGSVVVAPTLVTFAFQGFYRVNLWMLDAAGALAGGNPFFTVTFEVFPSAG